MATTILKAMMTAGTHAVGTLNNFKLKTLPHGAIVAGADIDNFTVVELGFDANGERTATQLSAKTKAGALIASVERRYVDGEQMSDFYNAVGERARIVIFEPNFTRFETSAYSKNSGVTTLSNGMVAHFDVATKKFIISASGTPHADYATSANQFVVVATEDELTAIDGMKVVRLECTK